MQTDATRPPLAWQFHPGAFWCAFAPSAAGAGWSGDRTHFMIGVDEHGSFCVTVNDETEPAGCRPSLAEAKAWCEGRPPMPPGPPRLGGAVDASEAAAIS